MLLRIAVGSIALALAASAQVPAFAQAFPSKPVRIIVPFSPGSILDTVSRFVATRSSEDWGQPVVVENRAGAGGRIGADFVAKSPPDGHVIVMGSVGTHVGVLFLSKAQPYDPVKDFTPISLAVEPVSAIVMHPSIPANTLKELIAYAKANPGKISYATNGVGTNFHVAGELLKAAAGFDMVHVPMKGAGDVMNALVGGHVPVAFSSAAQFPAHLASGKLKLLAMTGPGRYPRYPNTPAIAEEAPGFEYPGSWLGFLGPASMPPPVLARWNTAVVRSLTAPEVKGKLEDSGMAVVASTPQQFAEAIQRGMVTFGRAVKIAGIQPE
jgi:tripartite-type tricarboxylate transporter receptor subunit TctC